MFSQQSSSHQINTDLQQLKSLLEEKYLHVNVVNVCLVASNDIKVILLNGRHISEGAIDTENVGPIQYLMSFDGKFTEEKAKYTYWSHSAITFSQAKLQDIIKGLEIMPAPEKPENDGGKIYAMC